MTVWSHCRADTPDCRVAFAASGSAGRRSRCFILTAAAGGQSGDILAASCTLGRVLCDRSHPDRLGLMLLLLVTLSGDRWDTFRRVTGRFFPNLGWAWIGVLATAPIGRS
jgi:hypothetical protein